MDNNQLNDSPVCTANVSSLHGLYTDFDGWVASFNKCYMRSTHFSQEINYITEDSEDSRQNTDAIFEKDLFGDIFLRQWHTRHSAKPYSKFYKENDGFVFYDHVFYSFMNKIGSRRIFCQHVRSKL